MLSSIGINPLFTMKSGRDQLSRRKKEDNYEEAMNQAFREIFRNLKEIKEDTEKQRKKANIERARRLSAPAMTRKETSTTFQQSENEHRRKLSPASDSSLPTMNWVPPCFDEDDEDIEPVDFNFGALDNIRTNNRNGQFDMS